MDEIPNSWKRLIFSQAIGEEMSPKSVVEAEKRTFELVQEVVSGFRDGSDLGLDPEEVSILEREFGQENTPRTDREGLMRQANRVIKQIESVIEDKEKIPRGSVAKLREVRWDIHERGKG